MKAPTLKSTIADLPADLGERREAMVDLFGQHLFSLRNQLYDRMCHRVEDQASRESLGTIPARPYTEVAALDSPAREAALEFAREAIDQYMQLVLMLLQSTGGSWRFGSEHAIRYRLISEVIPIDAFEQVLAEAHINGDTEKALGTYFGRWLNRHGNHR